MSDVTETKPDPTSTTAVAAESTETPVAEKPAEKTGEEDKSATEKATDATLGAASKATDSVFSMFGGGPKKERKEEDEAGVDEPSGSSKAQKKEGEEVGLSCLVACDELCDHCLFLLAGTMQQVPVGFTDSGDLLRSCSVSYINFVHSLQDAGSNGFHSTGRSTRVPRGPL
jgi:hypothetical protein